jgi:hypothetical protein
VAAVLVDDEGPEGSAPRVQAPGRVEDAARKNGRLRPLRSSETLALLRDPRPFESAVPLVYAADAAVHDDSTSTVSPGESAGGSSPITTTSSPAGSRTSTVRTLFW